MALQCSEVMEFGQLMKLILVYLFYKLEMYIVLIALVITENVRIAFLYVLSIYNRSLNIFESMKTKGNCEKLIIYSTCI